MNGQQVQLISKRRRRAFSQCELRPFLRSLMLSPRGRTRRRRAPYPWERPMTAIATSLTGPVAYAIGLIGIAIAGGAMLWGGELTEFGRRACMIGLVVSVLVFAAPMLSSAFGVTAAVI